MKNYRIVVIGDYGRKELAFKEVRDRIEVAFDENDLSIASVDDYAVPAFNTTATGFVLAQLAMTTRQPTKKVYFVNTAPRGDDAKARVNNEGEGFVYVRLKNGVEIGAVNSGYSLSFVRDAAEEIREIKCSRAGSQFRSRDVFPPAFAAVLAGKPDMLGKDVCDTVPDMPTGVIVHIDGYGRGDGYGNLKVLVDLAQLEKMRGKPVFVTVQDPVSGYEVTHRALVTDRIFDVPAGHVAFALQGSSGWPTPDGGRRTFSEVVVRSGDAYEKFMRPKIGWKITWTAA